MATAENQIHNTNEVERLMLESWLPVAEKHARESGGAVGVLDIDPERYPAQRLDTYHLSGHPLDPAGVEAAAKIVEPLFGKAKEKLLDDDSSVDALMRAAEHIDEGGNVVAATNHTELTDVIMAQAAVYCYIKEQGIEFDSSVIISKMISLLASNTLKDVEGNPVPGVLALQVLCNDIFMSYPRSETTHNTPLARQLPEVLDGHNQSVSKAVKEMLGKGGVLLAMAPSGTTDKIDTSGKITTMQKVKSGTAKIMAADNTMVLPIAAHFGEDPFMLVSDKPRQLTSAFEAHDVMHSIARTLQAKVDGSDFQYR